MAATHHEERPIPAVQIPGSTIIVNGNSVTLLSRTNRLPWQINYGNQLANAGEASLDHFLKLVRTQLTEREGKHVSISTTHKYKGLEQDTIIVLDAVFRCYPLIHPDIMLTRVLGDTIEKTVEDERRLFYVALTRAARNLVLITEEDRLSPFLEDIRGNLPIPHINWSDYPPISSTSEYITVRVGTRVEYTGQGTLGIKDMLKAEGYKWHGTGWRHWWRTMPADGFSARGFLDQALWRLNAEGIEVRFHNDLDEPTAVYHVNKGHWYCVVDNEPLPTI